MKLIISPRAEKQLKKLPKIVQIAVANKIRSIGNESFASEEKLSGYKNVYRIRVGDYRIVYRKTIQELHIVLIHHRKDIYRLLSRLFG
ncbi:type II toxin-antitoxin system RelE/ParE family toxin [Candidatus Collierbacteria bacterium]|nr:type II toxin-antitoxin system RelE/ParE family toxin [Candidatus Collierbacteria bacterium]